MIAMHLDWIKRGIILLSHGLADFVSKRHAAAAKAIEWNGLTALLIAGSKATLSFILWCVCKYLRVYQQHHTQLIMSRMAYGLYRLSLCVLLVLAFVWRSAHSNSSHRYSNHFNFDFFYFVFIFLGGAFYSTSTRFFVP